MVKLTAELAAIKGTQPSGLPKGVKVNPPEAFKGIADGDSVDNFLAALNNYFALMHLEDSNSRARYAETLLVERARTWFQTKSYNLETLLWH